ncbi:thiamine biosynthesis protein MoeB [Gracilibacillus oryzae]|uniref:Thiamine biosynthesis protein MoeB n=1 Tax=Gracilibacillus oryzae TaxID=1672701 RepID=A0A7C8KUM6_9BACI|nr:MoeB/ThiF family adenylyltransferase [Gracilibacillus oryzae]KAB8139016.1 thiamine biosynthesis protein MoeB [Gracilibacillus oryzae]
MDNRYSRQTLFEPIGMEGQKKLADSHVLIIGIGALGSSSAEMLARAGVGKLTLIDRDYVEASNLQRQQLFTERDAEERTPKAIAAKRRLELVNSHIAIEALVEDAGVEELEKLVPSVDLIMDATDNFDTRLILNDISQKHQKPWIYGGCVASYGITFTVLPGVTPCFHCLLDHIPSDGATCDTVGIISPTVQMVVAHQMTEALKILTNNSEALSGKLIGFDLWKNQRMEIDVKKLKDQQCPSCVMGEYPNLTYDAQMKTAVLCGRDTVQIRVNHRESVNLDQLCSHLSQNSDLHVTKNPFLISFEVHNYRIVIFKDGRTFIHGTKDIKAAKKLYYQYVG